MERTFDSRQVVGAAKQKWVRSIFRVGDQLVKKDVSEANRVFMLGVGAHNEPQVFDVLASIEKAREREERIRQIQERFTLDQIFDEALDILQSSGAPRVRNWARRSVLRSVVDIQTASIILDALRTDDDFKETLAKQILPDQCREFKASKIVSEGFNVFGRIASYTPLALISNTVMDGATEDSMKKVVADCENYLKQKRSLESVSVRSVVSVTEAEQILNSGGNRQENLTDKKIDELIKAIEPCIYGATPLLASLMQSIILFSHASYKDHFKLLFVLSDGEPTDDENTVSTRSFSSFWGIISRLIALLLTALAEEKLKQMGVTIVSCYITDRDISDARRLYSTFETNWDQPAKFMFNMASTVSTQKIPRTLFIRKGWTIDTDNNETRLFFQINHPDLIDEVCDIAKSCVCSQDALSDVLADVDLDLYINRANEGFDPKRQSELTCYAVASATAMHLSMLRVVGRDGGYPDFFQLRNKIVAQFGTRRARTVEVLRTVCPEYRLQCKEVNERAALEAVIAKRPVVATFRLSKAEWGNFKQFFDQNPKCILTKSELDISQRLVASETFGHAVALMSFDRHSLRLMNSWGSSWGDGGFFRVQSAAVLEMNFIDVFWTEEQLTASERAAFKERGPGVAEKLFASLKGLQNSTYQCPLCKRDSLVSEFSGHMLEARCPRCSGSFNANLAGGDLALNLYLTSLLHNVDEKAE